MAISKKLETIYHNGQPDGIRSIRRHLSTMTTYVVPRPLLSEAKKLSGAIQYNMAMTYVGMQCLDFIQCKINMQSR